MWVQNGTTVLRMKLNTYKPLMFWYFHNFNQIGFGINAYRNHTVINKLLAVGIVKFVAMTVSFVNR